jgi:parallel beta-helix repeat protein
MKRKDRFIKNILTKFIFIFICFLSINVANATNYYVNGTNGSNSNTGLNIENAWKTIVYANRHSKAGDTVYVRAGTYEECVEIDPRETTGHGDARKYWKITNYNGETVNVSGSGNGFIVFMCSRVWVDGLYFINGAFVAAGAWKASPYPWPDHIMITNNHFYGKQARYGFIQVIGNDHTIAGNIIESTGGGSSLDHGIYPASGKGVTIRNNTITGASGWGIHLYDEDKGNEYEAVDENGYHRGRIDNVTIEGNTISNCGSGGIVIATQSYDKTQPLIQNVTVKNNIIYSTNNSAIEVRVVTKNIYIYNNTIYRPITGDKIAIELGECCGKPGPGDKIENVHIKNNIIDMSNVSGSYHISKPLSANFINIIVNNNLYVDSPARMRGSISDLKLKTGDPKFVSASSRNFHIQSDSAARDAGLTLSEVTYDKDGVRRPQGSGYDIGAYEYVSGNPVPAPKKNVGIE